MNDGWDIRLWYFLSEGGILSTLVEHDEFIERYAIPDYILQIAVDTLYLDSGEGPLQLISIDLVYSLSYNWNIGDVGNFSRKVELVGVFADYEVFLNLGDIVSDQIQHRHEENYAIVVIEVVAVSQIELRQQSIHLNRK